MACACGPGWLPSKLLHWYLKIPEGEECFYHSACVQHDVDYIEQVYTWKKCDDIFFSNMINCYSLHKPELEQLLRAVKYYNWVRRGGWISYYYYWIKYRVPIWVGLKKDRR